MGKLRKTQREDCLNRIEGRNRINIQGLLPMGFGLACFLNESITSQTFAQSVYIPPLNRPSQSQLNAGGTAEISVNVADSSHHRPIVATSRRLPAREVSSSITIVERDSDSEPIPLIPIESSAKPQLPPAPEIPSSLSNAKKFDVSLDFLIMSSIASRKALLSFNGAVVVEPITQFDYQLSNQARQIALSQFDPNIIAFMIGNDINQPANSFFGPGIQQQNQIDEIEFNAKIAKIWQTGLISSVGYEPSLAYLFFPQGNASGFNPTHASDLVTRIEQPLLRGAGRKVNLVNLRVAEWRNHQTSAQIETTLLSQLRSIEQVYWKLHAAYVRRRAIDSAIELAYKTVQVIQARFEAERAISSEVRRAEFTLQGILQQRIAAETEIWQQSFNLAQLSGLDLDGRVVLVPVTPPEFAPPQFDESMIVTTAIANNPNIKRQRQALEIDKLTAFGAKNSILPKLNLQAAHRTTGIQDDLGSSLKQMSSYQFNDFTLGLQYTQQIGQRLGRSQYAAANLQFARDAALLDAEERRVGFDILKQLNQLQQSYREYENALQQVRQSEEWVNVAQIRYEDPPVTNGQQVSILVLLFDYQTALQARIDSIAKVADALANYNTALALIDERRGLLASKWGIGTDGIGCPSVVSDIMSNSAASETTLLTTAIHSSNASEANLSSPSQSTVQSHSASFARPTPIVPELRTSFPSHASTQNVVPAHAMPRNKSTTAQSPVTSNATQPYIPPLR